MNNYINLIGGENDILPRGGFPPLYECDKLDTSFNTNDKKKREYNSSKVMSVKNILDDRRKTPFITLPDIKYQFLFNINKYNDTAIKQNNNNLINDTINRPNLK